MICFRIVPRVVVVTVNSSKKITGDTIGCVVGFSGRGGLKWLDVQCQKKNYYRFIDCSKNQKKEMLDEIAYAEEAKPEMQAGANIFYQFRDMVATGFWSSKMGIEDIR